MVAYRHAKVLQEWGQDVRIICGRFGDAATRPYQIEIEKGEFYVTRVSLSPRDLSGDLWHYDNHQITRAFAKTVDQFSPNVVHFRNLVGLSVKMIDECHRRGIPTVMTLHDHWAIGFKSLMVQNDGTVCTHGGFDCLDCKETLTEALAIPSPIRNAHKRHLDQRLFGLDEPRDLTNRSHVLWPFRGTELIGDRLVVLT
jgi:Glycosyl transferase 4-like domain